MNVLFSGGSVIPLCKMLIFCNPGRICLFCKEICKESKNLTKIWGGRSPMMMTRPIKFSLLPTSSPVAVFLLHLLEANPAFVRLQTMILSFTVNLCDPAMKCFIFKRQFWYLHNWTIGYFVFSFNICRLELFCVFFWMFATMPCSQSQLYVVAPCGPEHGLEPPYIHQHNLSDFQKNLCICI